MTGNGQALALGSTPSGTSNVQEGQARIDVRLVPSAMFAWGVALCGAFLPSLWTGGLCAGFCIAAGLLLLGRPQRTPHRPSRPGRAEARESSISRSSLRSLPATLAIACLFGAAVAAHAAMDAGPRQDGPVAGAAASRDSVVIRVRIVGDPRELGADSRGSGRWAVPAEVIDVAADGQLIRSRARVLLTGGEGWDQVVTGQVVRTAGKLKQAKAGQVEAGVLAAATPPLKPDARHDPGSGPRFETAGNIPEGPSQLKRRFSSGAEWLQGDAAGLLPGMVTGDTSGLDESLEAAMKTTGTTHLTAVSGPTG
jgi:competence protein ComEC